MSENPTPAPKRSLAARVGLWLVAALVIALLLVLAVHVMISPVAPSQPAPAGHFGEPCAGCHFVSEGVDVVPVD